jgi:hypothetical protein
MFNKKKKPRDSGMYDESQFVNAKTAPPKKSKKKVKEEEK